MPDEKIETLVIGGGQAGLTMSHRLKQRGLPHLQRAVAKGYFVVATLQGRPQFDSLRGDPRFRQVVADAEAGRARALAAFRDGDGERLLGRPS